MCLFYFCLFAVVLVVAACMLVILRPPSTFQFGHLMHVHVSTFILLLIFDTKQQVQMIHVSSLQIPSLLHLVALGMFRSCFTKFCISEIIQWYFFFCLVLNENECLKTGVFHRVVAMIQLARLVYQGLNHQTLLGKLIIVSILFRFFPIYKFQCGCFKTH